MNSLYNPIPSLEDSVNQWALGGKKKKFLILGIVTLICFLLQEPAWLLWYLPPGQPKSPLHASKAPRRPHCARCRGERRVRL